MEVWEKVNYLIEEKKLTKREFAERLISLTPILKRTGEIPSIQTVMGYLYGKRELKIELIPFIAEVLNVSEQELFSTAIEYSTAFNYKHSKEVRDIIDLLQYIPNPMMHQLKEQLQKYKELHLDTSTVIDRKIIK
jgi:transcriptional regulator with XRE-family HTH domain